MASPETIADDEEKVGTIHKVSSKTDAILDYAGTTAAGLNAMHESMLSQLISDSLLAAAQKARSMT